MTSVDPKFRSQHPPTCPTPWWGAGEMQLHPSGSHPLLEPIRVVLRVLCAQRWDLYDVDKIREATWLNTERIGKGGKLV